MIKTTYVSTWAALLPHLRKKQRTRMRFLSNSDKVRKVNSENYHCKECMQSLNNLMKHTRIFYLTVSLVFHWFSCTAYRNGLHGDASKLRHSKYLKKYEECSAKGRAPITAVLFCLRKIGDFFGKQKFGVKKWNPPKNSKTCLIISTSNATPEVASLCPWYFEKYLCTQRLINVARCIVIYA